MIARHWKFSQVISLAFVSAILVLVLIGAVTGNDGLMSDATVVQTVS